MQAHFFFLLWPVIQNLSNSWLTLLYNIIPCIDILLCVAERIKQTANLVLAVMMLFATYNHWMVGDKFERLAPSLVSTVTHHPYSTHTHTHILANITNFSRSS